MVTHDLYELADHLAAEPSEASARELIDFAYANTSPDVDPHGGVAMLASELLLADRAATADTLGQPGAMGAARRAHAAFLREAREQAAAHARARDAAAADRRLSQVGRDEALGKLAAEQAAERENLLERARDTAETLLETREKALLQEFGPRPTPGHTPGGTEAVLTRLEALERARLFMGTAQRLKTGAFNQAALEFVARDPGAAPNVVRTAAALFANDQAHATQLATLLASEADTRRATRTAAVFADPRDPHARAATELALLSRTRERLKLHREQIAVAPDSAPALADSFDPKPASGEV